MRRLAQVIRAAETLIILLVSASSPSAQHVTKTAPATYVKGPTKAPAYLKAFVIDERLSALRRGPDLQSVVIRRLRLAHAVFIFGTSRPKADQPRFCRVAVTRRTRGWIHESALAVQGRAGEDRRIVKLLNGNFQAHDLPVELALDLPAHPARDVRDVVGALVPVRGARARARAGLCQPGPGRYDPAL